MCGRVTITVDADEVAEWLNIASADIFQPRYNIAPTQWVPIVRVDPLSGKREAALLRWGFVPHWASELSIGNKMINARSESVYTKPSFRDAIRKRRCIIPVSGFYEWQRSAAPSPQPSPPKGREGMRERQPHLIALRSGRPFALGGMWETNGVVPEGPLETFTILTTAANALIEPLHDRMPLILPDTALDRWLDPKVEDVRALLVPFSESEMAMRPVSRFVNNPANEGAECLAEPEPQAIAASPAPKSKKNRDAPGQRMLF